MTKSKIFGIGLAKTGTTSLNDAFAILGISSIGCPESVSAIRRFDAATDGIVAARFEELDRAYPGSKYIYTVRERESWVRSYMRHYQRKQPSLHGHEDLTKTLYGTTGTEKDVLLDAYERHEHHVLEYFRNRPDDLLVMDICDGCADWGSLCAFLGKPVPDEPFPSSNPKFSNNIFLHLLYRIKDPDVVASITKAPVAYLNSLSTENYTPADLLAEDPTKRADRILVKSCKYFGGVKQAAEHLQLERKFLEAAIERHKKRKVSRLRKKKSYLEKKIDNLKRGLGL
jgi:Sulfotransferase domain